MNEKSGRRTNWISFCWVTLRFACTWTCAAVEHRAGKLVKTISRVRRDLFAILGYSAATINMPVLPSRIIVPEGISSAGKVLIQVRINDSRSRMIRRMDIAAPWLCGKIYGHFDISRQREWGPVQWNPRKAYFLDNAVFMIIDDCT